MRDRDLDDIVAHVHTLDSKPPRAPHLATEPVSLVRESPYDVATTVDKLKTALIAAGLRIIRAVPFDPPNTGSRFSAKRMRLHD